MNKKRLIFFLLYIVFAYLITFKFIVPAAIDFTLSDVFIKPTTDTAQPYTIMDNTDPLIAQAILQCESYLEENDTPEWSIDGYKVWALGDYHYMINAQTSENTFRYACKIRHYEGELNTEGWELLGVQLAN